MENAENQPFKANRPVGYSIRFEPEKPYAPPPKCVTGYSTKPALSPQELQRKMDQAAIRKKREEQAKLARIYRCQETAKNFDKKVRPFLDTMMHATEGQGGSRAF